MVTQISNPAIFYPSEDGEPLEETGFFEETRLRGDRA
jgi:hypothetical protein